MHLSIDAHWHINAPPQRIPRLWFLTDDRLGDANLEQLRRLRRGTGVVVRQRLASASFLAQVKAIARARGLCCVVSGSAAKHRMAGTHWPEVTLKRPHRSQPRQLMTASAHSRAALVRARRCGADAVFVSPLFATRSHPGGDSLGLVRFGLLCRDSPVALIALGGITPKSLRGLQNLGVYGIAAIGGWGPNQ